MYKLITSSRFDSDFKKLSNSDKELTAKVIDDLLSGKKLERKFKDHPLKGNLKGFRDCHIKPDLVLIYKIDQNELELFAFRIGSHSKVLNM